MPYNIKFSDPSKTAISVADKDLNKVTSLTFIGKNYDQSYSSIIGENFLHLLENFASNPTNKPSSPVRGQLWFNSSKDDTRYEYGLHVYDDTNWLPIGVLKKKSQAPTLAESQSLTLGDLYVDTNRQQLYIFGGGNNWTLVGPKYNIGEKTTAEAELITNSADDEPVSVLTIFVKNNRVAMISDREFVPKILIDGFPSIKQGITLSKNKFQSDSKINKFWGVSEKAESLIVGDDIVDAANILRSDVISTTNQGFNIRNNNGLSIGSDLSLSIGIDPSTNSSLISNKTSGSSISFKLINSNQSKTVMTIDSRSAITQRGSVGINNTAPDQTTSLDVIGVIKTDDSLIISGTNDSDVTNPSLPSFKTDGGAKIAKSLIIGSILKSSDTGLTITGITKLENLEPKITEKYDLGSSTKKWNQIWATSIGDAETYFYGSFNGSFNGNVSGYAQGLLDPGIGISIGKTPSNSNSDIVADALYVKLAGTTYDWSASLKPNFVSTKPELTEIRTTDVLLISRAEQLYKITRTNLFKNLPTVPAGSIMLWQNTSTIPSGYLICNGQPLILSEYQALATILGATSFVDNGVLKFNIPNLTSNAPPGMKYILFTGRTI